MRNGCTPSSSTSGAGLAAMAVLAIAATACLDDPIEERCTLRVEPEGEVRVTYEAIVHRAIGGNQRFDDRLAALQEELLGGWSPWTQRLDRETGQRDGLSWELWEGHLTRFERWVELAEPERQLSEVFADTPVDVRLNPLEGAVELVLVPGIADRAGRAERERVEDTVDEWSEAVAAHVATTAELWRYLEAHPSRARAVVEGLFVDLIADDDRRRLELLAEEEEALERSREAQERVAEIFDFPEEEAFTPQELSRRVYDPFPAAFVVELSEGSRVVEQEGFLVEEATRLRVPRLSLWDAYQTVLGRWLWPDPLVAQARHLAGDHDAPFPVTEFLDQEFRFPVTNPRAAEIAATLRGALRPGELFRVVVRLPAEDDDGASESPAAP